MAYLTFIVCGAVEIIEIAHTHVNVKMTNRLLGGIADVRVGR